jgi:Fe-S oxidoreductase
MRIDQAIKLRVDVIATACPYCTTMLTDGVKARGVEEQVRVLDIAELLEKSLSDEPKKI